MKDILITEDLSKIIEIGKEICAEKTNIYTPTMLNTIKGTIETKKISKYDRQ